jgi:lipoprotein-releasing system permease protein
MLVLDKKHDIATIRTIGGNTGFVRRIFVSEGMLISGLGVMGGILLGVIFCFIQQQWGIIKIGSDSFIVDSYPVVMKWSDILIVLVASMGVNYMIARLTVWSMEKKKK